MLIDEDTLRDIDTETAKLIGRFGRYLLEGENGALSLLEQTYIVGKATQILGPRITSRMTERQLQEWASENPIEKSKEDAAFLKALRKDSDKWLASLQDQLTAQIRTAVAEADATWTKEIYRRDNQGKLVKGLWDDLRNQILGRLFTSIKTRVTSFVAQADRFVQTEIAKYYQYAQMAGVPRDELVYKIPRPSACAYCMRLHLNEDGSPRKYRLRDVMGHSNIGKKTAGEWSFTVGPVHPHCYCSLHRESQDPDQGPDELLAEARRVSLTAGSRLSAEEQVRRARERLRIATERLEFTENAPDR